MEVGSGAETEHVNSIRKKGVVSCERCVAYRLTYIA